MLESVSPDLVAHQGSPTKHPARRLETIRAAGELRIPFTSGILVGIGESEEERIAALEALAACTPSTATCRRSSSRTSSRTTATTATSPRRSPTTRRASYWRTGIGDGPRPLPAWATPVTIDDMRRLVGEAGGCCPASASRCRRTSPTGGPSSCGAGATDLGGLSANGDHISPEHPFPSPHQVRKRLAAPTASR